MSTTEVAEYEVQPNTNRQIAVINTAANMAMTLKEEGKIREMLREYIEKHMVEGPGKDFGKIPGTETPCLFQSGAEKTLKLFRLVPKPELTEKVQNWDPAAPLFHYSFRVELVSMDSGVVVGVGIGSCNSMEDRYRWRKGERKCPQCGAASIIKGKAEYGGGWLCWKKKGGCDAKFQDGDKTIESQEQGKILNEGIFTQVNTIEKMAYKRALVSACVPILRGYGFDFTQDMEDMAPEERERAERASEDRPREQQQAAKKDPPKQENKPTTADDEAAQKSQPIRAATATKVGLLFEQLNLKWEDRATKDRAQKGIGRPVGDQEQIAHLKEHEGQTLIRKLQKLLETQGTK